MMNLFRRLFLRLTDPLLKKCLWHRLYKTSTGKSQSPHWFNQLMYCDCADAITRYHSTESNYQDYLWQHSYLSCVEKRQNQRSIKFWRDKPLISIQLCVHKVNISHLQACLDSVSRQLYPHWQLCIVEDGSGDQQIKKTLQAFKKQYPDQVKLVLREENKGITVTSQEAFALTDGEFVALLDHDDYLAPEAFYEGVKLINQQPEVDWIYSDNDKLDSHGNRCCLHAKPAWSPELLMTYNYILHLSIIRRTLIQQADGFRNGFEGSQDHDLYLRLSELTHNIVHIPRILYYWRQSESSVALDPQNKRYAFDAALRALDDSLKRKKEAGYAVHPEHSWLGSYQIIREIDKPEIEIIFLPEDCDNKAFVESYFKQQTNCIINKIFWLESDNNVGSKLKELIQQCQTPYLLMVNPTIQFQEDNQLFALAANLAPKGVAVSTAKVINSAGQVDHCGLAYQSGNLQYPLRGWDKNLDGIGAFGALPRNISLSSTIVNYCKTDALKRLTKKLSLYQKTSAWFTALGLEIQATNQRIVVDGGIPILNVEQQPYQVSFSLADQALLQSNYPHFFNKSDPLYIRQMNQT